MQWLSILPVSKAVGKKWLCHLCVPLRPPAIPPAGAVRRAGVVPATASALAEEARRTGNPRMFSRLACNA